MSGNLDKQYEAHLLPSNVCNGLERIISLSWIGQVYTKSERGGDAGHTDELLADINEVASSLLYQFSEWQGKQPDGKLYEIFDE